MADASNEKAQVRTTAVSLRDKLEAKLGTLAEETDRSIALIEAPPKLNLTVK